MAAPSSQESASTDPAVLAAQAEIDRLRPALEATYRAMQVDHADARDEHFVAGLSAPDTGRLMDELRLALADDSATAVARVVGAAPDDFVLSQPTLRIVLSELLRDGGIASAGRDLEAEFVERTAALFAPDDFTQVWDAHCGVLPIVAEWRAAHDALESAREAIERSSVTETPLIELDHGRFEVGPWEGWTSDIAEKDNRRKKVRVKRLHVDAHEVTCAQYLAFLEERPKDERAALLPGGWLIADGVPAYDEGLDDHPVTRVSIAQAMAYAAAYGKRLPTEAEWERIASGGDAERRYPWGSDAAAATWAFGDHADGTRPVGAFPDDVTPDGVLGLAGNVAEIVATLSDGRDVVRGKVDASDKLVIRGGSFRSRASDCTTTFRWTFEAEERAAHVGFRCVMDHDEFRRRQDR